MKSRIEDFIRQNREAFDDKEPPQKIWKKVEASLHLSGQSWWNSLTLWRAAAVVFMVLSAYLLLPKQDGSRSDQKDLVLNEFHDVEAFYTQQIADKVQLIDKFNESEELNGFTQDIHQLEAMYMVLKEEFKIRPGKKVKDALILNLLVRIDLLNQQLHKLERENSEGDPVQDDASI